MSKDTISLDKIFYVKLFLDEMISRKMQGNVFVFYLQLRLYGWSSILCSGAVEPQL